MDATKCKEGIWDNWHKYQCSRNIWKDGYCKQHHPDSVKEREKKRDERYKEQQEKSPWRQLEEAKIRIKDLEGELVLLKDELEYLKGLSQERGEQS